MLAFVEKLLADLHFREQGRAIQCASIPGLLVFARLLQVGAIARTIERDLALFATALRTDSSVDGGPKPLLFPEVADRTAHRLIISCRLGDRFSAPLVEQSCPSR